MLDVRVASFGFDVQTARKSQFADIDVIPEMPHANKRVVLELAKTALVGSVLHQLVV